MRSNKTNAKAVGEKNAMSLIYLQLNTRSAHMYVYRLSRAVSFEFLFYLSWKFLHIHIGQQQQQHHIAWVRGSRESFRMLGRLRLDYALSCIAGLNFMFFFFVFRFVVGMVFRYTKNVHRENAICVPQDSTSPSINRCCFLHIFSLLASENEEISDLFLKHIFIRIFVHFPLFHATI